MNDETNNCHANAGVGHIKRRPGVRERNMQIEEQEIDDVTVDQTVGEISKQPASNKASEMSRRRIR